MTTETVKKNQCKKFAHHYYSDIRPGDIFCSRNPMMLGRVINAVQRFYGHDRQSEYSHAGIIIAGNGTTMESLLTVKTQNLFTAYSGKEILIGRHRKMGDIAFERGLANVKKHYGDIYPFHRLIFFLLPVIAQHVSTGRFLVCSELTAKFLFYASIMNYYKGITPDDIADMIRDFKGWSVVYEGVL